MQQRFAGLLDRLEWARDRVEAAFATGAASPDDEPGKASEQADEG